MQKEGSFAQTEQFVTLERDTPRKAQAASGAVIGAVLLLIGGFILYKAGTQLHGESLAESWVTFAVGGGFALMGFLMEYAAIHQYRANQLPEAEVAIDTQSLHPGDPFCLRVRQPGPIQLKSLSANLVCEVIVRKSRRKSEAGGGAYSYSSSYPFKLNIFRTEGATAASGARIEQVATFRIPDKAEPSSPDSDRTIVWRIEVWGKVAKGADFMHPYTIVVAGAETTSAHPET